MSISVTGEAKFAKQTGGRGQYGHVVLRLTLHEADTGVTVVNRLAGDPIPAQFIPAIEAVCRRSSAKAGWPDAGIRVGLSN
jgi:elongation factor G